MKRPALGLVLSLSLLPSAVAAESFVPGTPIGVEPPIHQRQTRGDRQHPTSFYVLSSVRMGTALLDAWTTNRVLSRHPNTTTEGNPFMKPFVAHPASLYAMMATLAAVQIWVTDQRLHRGESWKWLPIMGASASGFVAVLNMRFD